MESTRESARVVWGASLLTLAIALLALASWALDIPWLRSPGRDWFSMRPVTAICLVGCSAGLVLAQRANRVASRILGLAVALTGVVSLAGHFEPASRMAAESALLMLGFGLALAVLASPGARAGAIGHALVLATALLNYLLLVSYALDARPLRAWMSVPSALNTAMAGCAVALGLLYLRPDTWFMRVLTAREAGASMARRLLPAVALIPVLIGGLHVWAERAGVLSSEVAAAVAFVTDGFVLLCVLWLVARSANAADRLRRQSEAALEESEARYRSLVEMSPDAVIVSRDGQVIQVNPAALRLLGATAESQVVGRPLCNLFHPGDHAVVRDHIVRILAGQAVPLHEHKILRLDGTLRDTEAAASAVREQQGAKVQMVLRDVTQRKLAEAALRDHREWLRVTLTSIGDAVLATDAAGKITFLNPVAATLTGWSEAEALGKAVQQVFRILNEQTHQEAEDVVAQALRAGGPVLLANHTVLVAKDGREIPIEDSAAPIRDSAGLVTGVVLVFHDVTARRRAEEKLRESEQRVRRKLESILSPEGDISTLELGDILDAPGLQALLDSFYELTRVPAAIFDLKGKQLAGAGWQEVCLKFHRAHPETCKHCVESDTQLTTGIAPGEFRLYKCKNQMWDVATPLMIGGQHVGNVFSGQFFFADEPIEEETFASQAKRYGFEESAYLTAIRAVPRMSREGLATGMAFLTKLGQMLSLLSYSNIKLARSLAERDALMDRLNRGQEIAHLGSWELDLAADRLTWSDEVYRIFGLRPQEFGASYEAFLEAVHPDDRVAVDGAYSGSLRDGRSAYEITHRVVRKGTGEVRWVHEKCEHVRDDTGRIIRSIGMVQDITERKRVEEQMRHAQKLESIGLLAGGIAHDFNNLLVGVIGNATLAEDMLPPGSAASVMLQRIVKCGEQAAHLTRQMLAYAGKGRFVLEPVDLTAMVRDTAALIHSSISQKIAVRLELDPETPAVESDPSQMQQVCMNLVLNAAEAIGDAAGEIVITTGEVKVEEAAADEVGGWPISPGRCAFLEVRDTGCGMDDDTRSRIFDPFFTTKFQGRGLGLAAVAGIVRAQKGAIRLATASGVGSTFRVLFPALQPIPPAPKPDEPAQEDLRGQGTVLVVDDEQVVREMAKAGLEHQGYEVLVAESGPAAIEMVRSQGPRIRLVVLDHSMPGMTGEETLRRLREIQPDLDVIVSSGYSETETLRQFQGVRLAAFIQKPYTSHELSRAVKLALRHQPA